MLFIYYVFFIHSSYGVTEITLPYTTVTVIIVVVVILYAGIVLKTDLRREDGVTGHRSNNTLVTM